MAIYGNLSHLGKKCKVQDDIFAKIKLKDYMWG